MGSSKKHRERDREREPRKRKHSPEEQEEKRKRKHSPEDQEEKRKRKHSPHSKSPEDKTKHRKRHHKEKRRSKKDEPEEVVLVPPPPKISRPATPPPPIIAEQGSRSDSLSVDETNKLRARLGLKPLSVKSEAAVSDAPKDLAGGVDMGEFVHRPPESIGAKKKQEKLAGKLTDRRERRRVEAKLAGTKALGDESDEEDDAAAWVNKSRAMQLEKDKANKRAAELDALDAEFGLGALAEETALAERTTAYQSRHLRGLAVAHDPMMLAEGRTVVLTLKDSGVLDEEPDQLVNVNLVEDERYKKNNEVKKLRPGYDALTDDPLDDVGNSVKPSVLSKYDEEIDGEKKSSFTIGENVAESLKRRAASMLRDKMHGKTAVSLVLPPMQLASEFYSPEEMSVKFNKTKKKVRKIRKKLKADDLLPLPGGNDTTTFGSRNVKVEDDDDVAAMDVDQTDAVLEETSRLEEEELQKALRKALRSKTQEPRTWGIEEAVAAHVEGQGGDEEEGGTVTLNATAEFCRTLGDIPTYGLAGNRDNADEELMDFQRSELAAPQEVDSARGAWNAVQLGQGPTETSTTETPILDAEPDLGMGVAGALRLAVSKGYLEREGKNKPSASRFAHLNAQNYSIEDKTHIDDDKFGRRERYSGPTSDFKEKAHFVPNVKLDYIDDDGHLLSAKEAFRYLSHKFHGKGPGKNKVEKRMKKNEQEGLMKCMSSTDTPLGTLHMLQAKQRETQSPFVVLSGTKQASISKTKL